MRKLLILMSLLTINTMAFEKAVDPSASLLKECFTDGHSVTYYRCPFGFCYEVKYLGDFGESFASSLSQDGPGFVGPNARKVYLMENLDRALFIKDTGEKVTIFTNRNESIDLLCK